MTSTAPTPPQSLRLKIESDPANLAEVRRAVEAFASQSGIGSKGVEDIGLCLNEALANVIRHAYGGAADRPIQIDADADGEAVKIRIRDWGNRINPATLPPAKHDPLKPGGLGLICIRELMDEVIYASQPDGMLLTMTKFKSESKSSQRG